MKKLEELLVYGMIDAMGWYMWHIARRWSKLFRVSQKVLSPLYSFLEEFV